MSNTVLYTYHKKTDSTAISDVWYNAANRELFIKFRGSGTIAGYKDVSPIAVDRLVMAGSIGRHYSQYIKNGEYDGINTQDLELVSAYPAQVGTFKFSQPKQAKKVFTITGVVTKEISQQVQAHSMEEAVNAFIEEHKNDKISVKTASVSFE